jgi:uncharacterized membrane protein YsdA (DUF1294 family)
VNRAATGRRSSPTPIFTLGAAILVAGALYGAHRACVAIWIGYLAGVNLAALVLYGYDKAVAGGPRTRVPEAVLHGVALLGGSPAALAGQLLFRHKTVKPSFQLAFRGIVAAQILILALAFWWRSHPPAWMPEGARRLLSGG